MITRNFYFQEGEIKIHQDANGEYWFVAKDICKALGISDTRQAVEKLDEDEKLIGKLYHSGQNRDSWMVSESGLYTLILSSIKPEAKVFRRWITHEVLPAIRQTGKFETQKQAAEISGSIDMMQFDIQQHRQVARELGIKVKAKQLELRDLLMDMPNQLKLAM